jgi:predicted ABC-type ATPase
LKIAYIMRGVPGSGKSTVAKSLLNGNGVIHSTDDLFYVGEEYCFDPAKLPEYHRQNYEAFCCSLEKGAPVVICDNTNVKKSHFMWYVEAAQKAGYIVAIIFMPHPDPEVAAARNIHKVPAHTIQRMIKQWED